MLHSLEALNIFRIVQEALNNAVKYSRASLIRVRVHRSTAGLEVAVLDNGEGFNIREAEKGYGLQNMQKRAEEMSGILTIDSLPGSGTCVTLSLPKSQPFSR